MLKDNMRQLMFMFLVDIQCHSKECLLILSIIGYFSHFLMLSSSTCFLVVILITHALSTLFWEFGQSFNSVITNVIWFFPALEETKKKQMNMKMFQRKEAFLMDGDSIWYHVQIIFGKHSDGSSFQYWPGHGLHISLQ